MDLLVWMEFREPEPAEVVERLDANGVEKIFNISASQLLSLKHAHRGY